MRTQRHSRGAAVTPIATAMCSSSRASYHDEDALLARFGFGLPMCVTGRYRRYRAEHSDLWGGHDG